MAVAQRVEVRAAYTREHRAEVLRTAGHRTGVRHRKAALAAQAQAAPVVRARPLPAAPVLEPRARAAAVAVQGRSTARRSSPQTARLATLHKALAGNLLQKFSIP